MVDHDGVADLFVAGRTFWWWWRGENSPNDSDVFWGLGEQAMVERGATTGPIAIVELDADPITTHVLGFELIDADTYFTIWEHNTATQAVTSANVLLSASGLEPLDLAVCGDRAWVVLSGKAMTVDISDLTAPVKGVEASTAGTRIDCGAGPGGAEAALLGDGQVQWVDVNIAQQSLLTTPGAEDVAVGDVGNGTEVRTCDDEGCSIVYWTWGATTAEAGFASGSSDSLGVADADGTRLLTGYGQLSVGDVDGNGFDDLVGIGADGLISVHRSNGVAMHHGEYFHTRNPPTTALAIGDADGDGFADFWMRDADDRLLFTVAPIIAGETTTTTGSTTATDTGDTGLP